MYVQQCRRLGPVPTPFQKYEPRRKHLRVTIFLDTAVTTGMYVHWRQQSYTAAVIIFTNNTLTAVLCKQQWCVNVQNYI